MHVIRLYKCEIFTPAIFSFVHNRTMSGIIQAYVTQMMNPASWNESDVERWARQVGLSESTIMALSENEIDGPT